jgi:hypothetical protein
MTLTACLAIAVAIVVALFADRRKPELSTADKVLLLHIYNATPRSRR